MTTAVRRFARASIKLLLCVAGCLAAAAASPAHAESDALARARALLAAGQPRQALPLCDAAIARDPTSASAYLLRGKVKIELKDWPGSEADLQKALDLAPDDPDALYWRGYRYAMDGKDKLAIGLYDRAIALAPGRADLWYARGTARERRNNFAGAREDYRQALRRAPDDADARRELNGVEERLGLPPTSAEEIERAAAAHAAAGGDATGRPLAEEPTPARPGARPTPGELDGIPGIEPIASTTDSPPPPRPGRPSAGGLAGGTAVAGALSSLGLGADLLPPEVPAGAAAAADQTGAPPPGIHTDPATAASASELLLTFARSILYLGPLADSPGELRAVCESPAGSFFAIDLVRDPQTGEVNAGPATAIALGSDRAYALVVAQRYAAAEPGAR